MGGELLFQLHVFKIPVGRQAISTFCIQKSPYNRPRQAVGSGMTQFVDGLGDRRRKKTGLSWQGLFACGQAIDDISVKHGMGGTDGPGHTVMGHHGDFFGRGFGEKRVGGHNGQGRVLARRTDGHRR